MRMVDIGSALVIGIVGGVAYGIVRDYLKRRR